MSLFEDYVATHGPADLLALAEKRIDAYMEDEDGDLTALESARMFVIEAAKKLPERAPDHVDDPWLIVTEFERPDWPL